jgi:hypothetical protein
MAVKGSSLGGPPGSGGGGGGGGGGSGGGRGGGGRGGGGQWRGGGGEGRGRGSGVYSSQPPLVYDLPCNPQVLHTKLYATVLSTGDSGCTQTHTHTHTCFDAPRSYPCVRPSLQPPQVLHHKLYATVLPTGDSGCKHTCFGAPQGYHCSFRQSCTLRAAESLVVYPESEGRGQAEGPGHPTKAQHTWQHGTAHHSTSQHATAQQGNFSL